MCGAKCARHMEKNLGIRVLTGKALEKITADDKGVTGKFGDETLKADLLLSAIGRKPVTEGLKLENAGVKTTERGFIEADDYCRTKVPTIFAIGDVTGKIQLAHYATAQGIAAAENAVRQKPHKHETIVPNVIFTVARSRHRRPQRGRREETEPRREDRQVPFRRPGQGLATGETTGFVKWIADATTDQLLGAAAVGPHATELIAEAAAAIRCRIDGAGTGSHDSRAPDVQRKLDGSRARGARRVHPRPAEAEMILPRAGTRLIFADENGCD